MPADWSVTPQDQAPAIIHSFSQEALGVSPVVGSNFGSSTTWGVTNWSEYVPFIVSSPMVVTTMGVFNGASVSGNLDIGVYDDQANRITHSGSTAQSGTNAWQSVAVAGVTLQPGIYYMALNFDNTSARYFAIFGSSLTRAMGMLLDFGSTLVLPTTATWVVETNGVIPMMCVSTYSF